MNTEQKLYDDNGEELPNRITYTVSFTYDVAEVIQSIRDLDDEAKIYAPDIYLLVTTWAEEDTGHKGKHLTATYIFTDREETE